MSWDTSLDDLLDLLVRNYPDTISARDVAEKSKLSSRFINFSGTLDNVWMSIIREARKSSNGLDELAKVAQKDYPNVDFLNLVRQVEEPALKGPKLREADWKGRKSVDQTLEKVIGKQPTFLPISFLEVGLSKARSVARVVRPSGLGTGFLTTNNILITNNHVIPTPDTAREVRLEFNYQLGSNGLAMPVEEFHLAPEDGFATSPMVGGDDWTAVRLKGDANSSWGALEFADTDVKPDDYVNIIQHPGGLHKQLALYHNVVEYVGGDRVQYLTDTLPGSSGSPVFNSQWQIVALHHSGGMLTEPTSDRKRFFFRNEGILASTVVRGLKSRGF